LVVAVVPSLSVCAAKGAPAVPGGSPTAPIPGLFVAPKPAPPPNREVPLVVEVFPKPVAGLDPKRPLPPEPPKGVEPDAAVAPPVELPAPKPPNPVVPVPELEPKRPPPVEEVPPNAGLLPKAFVVVDPNAEVPI
jgi:hypothetical protein